MMHLRDYKTPRTSPKDLLVKQTEEMQAPPLVV